MTFTLSQRSLDNLTGVHPDLVRVVKEAIKITPIDFVVIEGLRSKERQMMLFAKGDSQTLNSRHMTGHAVDLAALVDGKVSWDMPLYSRIAAAMLVSAKHCGIEVEWGGGFRTFKDGPHFQLKRTQ